MAVGKKINKLVDNIDFDRFEGLGSLHITQCGLKYMFVYVEGDWKHMHQHFTSYLEALASQLNITVKEVDFIEDIDEGDWYGGTYKFLVQ